MALAEDLHIENGEPEEASNSAASACGDDVDTAFSLILDVVRMSPVDDGLARSACYRNKLVAVEAELLAKQREAGESDRGIEKRAGRTSSVTKAEAKKTARRSAAVEKNPTLANDLADGELGIEQLDAIATGAAKTEGAAACDQELIDEVKSAPPDEARRIVNRWVDDNTSDKKKETHRDRQRRLRGVSRFTTKRKTEALLLEGDTEAIDEIERVLVAESDRLYRRDGGRDLPKGKHKRSRTQRMFDAAHQLVTGSKRTKKKSTGSGIMMFVSATLDDVVSGEVRAMLANGSRLPNSVLDRHMCNGSIAGIVFDKDGEILWLGRTHRYATPAQIRGLAARDRGCVLCTAPESECEAHHLLPWNAPLQGRTDIDKMAFVCIDCHHYIHNNTLTLYRSTDGHWHLRPATPAETPPKHHCRRHE